MKGDFSTWRFDPSDNYQGVLFQQGRVMSDADLSEAETIALTWRITAARDIIGVNVAAVPAAEPNGYRVKGAVVQGADVELTLGAGRIWADGLHLRLSDDDGGDVQRLASYLSAPHNGVDANAGTIAAGVRDAVILEVSLDALNGFQDPARLIEPALGGPDTSERIIPRAGLRLLRLGPNEDCRNIGARLRADAANQGHLTVSLSPPVVAGGDCPVADGGGYTGFEHNLYRIEIARTNAGAAMFKWSQFNGGLVGRGRFTGGADPRVDITANRAAILTSGLSRFYLEALEFDASRGHWRVAYGSFADLNADDELDLTAPPVFGAIPGAGTPVFFRLWNGLRPLADFTNVADPVILRDGIGLAFQSDDPAFYRPGAWWNFDLRARDISNPELLVDDARPSGPVIRRVPLAEIIWAADRTAAGIEDCRHRIRPLSNQKLCCTYVVGNGVTSFGDFNSLEEAAAHLPPSGGRLCLLPGVHFANLSLVGRRGIDISGCRHKTILLPRIRAAETPIITVAGGQDISIADIDFIAPFGVAIAVAGTAKKPLREVTIKGCRMLALSHGIHVETVSDITILHNHIWLLDHPQGIAAITIRATDGLIEQNKLGVWPFEFKPPNGGDGPQEDPDPSDPCITPEQLYGNINGVVAYVATVWAGKIAQVQSQPYRARGGIHIKGASESLELRRNNIDGGLGHGITLGGTFPDDDENPDAPDALPAPQVRVVAELLLVKVVDDRGAILPGFPVSLAKPGDLPFVTRITDDEGIIKSQVDTGTYDISVEPGYEITRIDTAPTGQELVHTLTVSRQGARGSNPDRGFITDLRIIENRIERMGLSGIGFWFHAPVPAAALVPAGLDIGGMAGLISQVLAPKELIHSTNMVRNLEIRSNQIINNLRAVFTDLLKRTALFVAQGGISLAIVEQVRISGNQIDGNGTTADNPTAGIFVGYGEQIEISDNRIIGNGPVSARYRELRSDGLRGGVFIRMAATVVASGVDNGLQNPALLIRDNVIDQPAGRAITALCYGPVTITGNTLNSEFEGSWNAIDDLVGGILLLNLGGVHRLFGRPQVLGSTGFVTGVESPGGPDVVEEVGNDAGLADLKEKQAYVKAKEEADKVAARRSLAVERMLPGGETLVNSNRIRTGPDNKTWTSQIIVTLDDLGYDGNQSATFRPDATLSNLVAMAHSLRVTDNRFRERAYLTAMSALSVAAGTNTVAGRRGMNFTTQNQGDHCIVAFAFSDIPVQDSPNQVVFDANCPDVGKDQGRVKGAYVLAALRLAWQVSVDPGFTPGMVTHDPNLQVAASLDQFQEFQMQIQGVHSGEAARYETLYGAGNVRVKQAKARAHRIVERAETIAVQRDMVAVKEVETPESGLVLDGRVSDPKGRSVPGAAIEIVSEAGESLKVGVTTDKFGYYAIRLNADIVDSLRGRRDLFLRVTDAKGTGLSKKDTPLATLKQEQRLRNDIEVVKRPRDMPPAKGQSVETFVRPVVNPRAAEPEARSAPDPIPLEQVKGIGPSRASILRQKGVQDAAALAALSLDELKTVLGSGNLRAILRAAAEAIRRQKDP